MEPLSYRDPIGIRKSLEPGTAYYHNEVLIYCPNRNELVFPEEGQYHIRVDYRGKQSNIITITVEKPVSTTDAKWAEAINSKDVLVAMQRPAWRNDYATEVLRACAIDESTYSPYAAYFLVAYWGNEALEEKARMLDIADIEGFPLKAEVIKQKEILAQQTLAAQVRLKPEALEVSPGVLTAFVRLPEGYPVTNIISATCDGAKPERMMPNDNQTEMIIKFRRKDIEAALAQIGQTIDANFVVRGTWQGRAGTRLFQGTDSIKKIVGAKEKQK